MPVRTVLLFFVCLLAAYPACGQGMREMEDSLLRFRPSEEHYSRQKLALARYMLSLDPMNETAADYILGYEDDSTGRLLADSVRLAPLFNMLRLDPFHAFATEKFLRNSYGLDSIASYFTRLLEAHPGRPEPFLLRATLTHAYGRFALYYKDRPAYIAFLKQGLRLPEIRKRMLFYIGEAYYHDHCMPRVRNTFNYIVTSDGEVQFKQPIWIDEPEYGPVDFPSVFDHPADSALAYLTAVWKEDTLHERIYYPIRQLAYFLGQRSSVVTNVPEPECKGCYAPFGYSAGISRPWVYQDSVNLLDMIGRDMELETETAAWYHSIDEPSLFAMPPRNDAEVYRFSLFPSFHPTVVIRLEQEQGYARVHWKVVKRASAKGALPAIDSGSKAVTASQFRKFSSLLRKANFAGMPRVWNGVVMDGATWTLEQRTAAGYKAFESNLPCNACYEDFRACCHYLAGLAGLSLPKGY